MNLTRIENKLLNIERKTKNNCSMIDLQRLKRKVNKINKKLYDVINIDLPTFERIDQLMYKSFLLLENIKFQIIFKIVIDR